MSEDALNQIAGPPSGGKPLHAVPAGDPASREPSGPPLGARKAARGALWAAADNWIQQGFALITFIVVGNIVGPQVYGLMALGFLYIVIAGALLRDTFGEAIIQRAVLEAEHLDAAFWAQMALGVALAALSLLAADAFAALFGDPAVAPVIRVLGCTFPLMAASNFLRALVRRRMDYRALAIRSLVAFGAAAVLAIVLALRGAGVWSLLSYQLCLYALDLLMLLVQVRWWPRLRFSRRHFGDIADFSWKMMGNNVVSNISGQADRLLIGYFIGVAPLGLYGMGKRVVDGIDQTVIGVVGTMALPTFARVQTDKAALRETLVQATHYASLIVAPVYIGLALVGQRLVDVTLNPEWHATGDVIALLCLSGGLYPAVLFLAGVQRALGQAGLVLWLAIAGTAVRLGACLGAVLMGTGILGIMIATLASSFLMFPVRVYFVHKAIGLDARAFLKGMAVPFLATAVMALAVHLSAPALDAVLPPLAVVVAMIAIGVAVYAAGIAVLARPSLGVLARSLLPRRFLPQR